MGVCCGAIAFILFLALASWLIKGAFHLIVDWNQRRAWAKTLVDLPMDKLKSELSALTVRKGHQDDGVWGGHGAAAVLDELEGKIAILKRVIRRRQRVESDKSK
jgi:hypothetical protein